LRIPGEVDVSNDIALKLKRVTSATIDRKLEQQREVLNLLRSKGDPKPGSLLKRKIPIRLAGGMSTLVGIEDIRADP
jgi:hypothetical protein